MSAQAIDLSCPFCGAQEAELEVFEVWEANRTFQLTGCCQGNVEGWERELVEAYERDDEDALAMRRSFRDWLYGETGISIRGVSLGLEGGLLYSNAGVTLDYGIELGPVDLKTAKAFVLEHHRHNRPPCSWRWGHGLYNGSELVAIAMVGRPVARGFDKDKVVEVNRLCINPGLPSELTRHGCSKLYAAAAREAKKRGFERIVTYTLETELGTSLQAVGWTVEAKTKGGSWNCPSRPRKDTAPTCKKVRWGRQLRKARKNPGNQA